jgi:hypothetical protein
MFKLSKKIDGKYLSEMILKFIKGFIFITFKLQIEKYFYYSCFYWKKMLGILPQTYILAAFLKLRPIVGFYLCKLFNFLY